MMSTFMGQFFCLMLCVLTGGVKSGGLSENLLKFVYDFNGDYDNMDQVAQGTTDNAFIQCKVVPIDIPGLRELQAPLWYVEWATNGVILHMQVGVLHELKGGIIVITLYNFTDSSKYRPGELNVNDLSSLTTKDLHGDNCNVTFIIVTDNVYLGNWQDCRYIINGNYASYATTVTCDTLGVIVPRSPAQHDDLVPYVINRKRERYPVIGAPDNYATECSQSK